MKDYVKAAEVFEAAKEKFYNIDEKSPSYIIKPGTQSGIIFSCPHAVAQIREGKEKLADIFTGPLGMALNSLGYMVIIKTKTENDDANYDKRSFFKRDLSRYIKSEKIKFLVDLHGMSAKRDILISLGTAFGKHIDSSVKATQIFIDCAEKNSINPNLIRVDFPFSASKRTVSHYINRKNGIETLQVEINSKLFAERGDTINLIKTIDEFAQKIVHYKEFRIQKFDRKTFLSYDNRLINHDFEGGNFLFKEGVGEILISAPHSSSMFKEGKECYCESHSGAIALQLSDKLQLPVLIKTKSTDCDSTEEYLQNMGEILHKNLFKFVLELHIMNKERKEDIAIVCNSAKTIDYNIPLLTHILKILQTNGFKDCSVDYPFNGSNLNSTINQIKQNYNVPAMQLIINKKIVDSPSKQRKLMKMLQQLINLIKIYS